jgi:hypothetical protein
MLLICCQSLHQNRAVGLSTCAGYVLSETAHTPHAWSNEVSYRLSARLYRPYVESWYTVRTRLIRGSGCLSILPPLTPRVYVQANEGWGVRDALDRVVDGKDLLVRGRCRFEGARHSMEDAVVAVSYLLLSGEESDTSQHGYTSCANYHIRQSIWVLRWFFETAPEFENRLLMGDTTGSYIRCSTPTEQSDMFHAA